MRFFVASVAIALLVGLSAAPRGTRATRAIRGLPALKARKVLQARLAPRRPARSGPSATLRKPRAVPTRSWSAPIAPAEPHCTSTERPAQAVTAPPSGDRLREALAIL
jgi:hypothetical protein